MQIIVSVRNFFTSLNDSKGLLLEKLIRLTVYLGIFLVPVFFLPWSNNSVEYWRLVIFIALIALAAVFWLIKAWLTKSIDLRYKFLDLPIVIFVFIYFLASLFSVDRYQSFWGNGYLRPGSFVILFLLSVLYFLVSRFLDSIKHVKMALHLLNISVLLVLILNVIKIFGWFSWLESFSLSINTFNFILALGFILNGSLSLTDRRWGVRYLHLFLGFVFLVVTYLVHEPYLLLVLMLMLFIGILVLSFKSKSFSNKLIIGLTLILFMTALVLIVPVSKFTHLVSPREINLPLSYGLQITKAALSENLLLGVGPQNFAYSFYKYKPIAFNQTNFWQLGFANDSNFWLGMINDIGLLGLICVLIILIQYFYRSLKFVKSYAIIDSITLKYFIVAMTVSLVLLGLIIFGLFYSFDFILSYLMFIFLGFGAGLIQLKTAGKEFTNKVVVNLMFYFLIVLVICFVYFSSRFIKADLLAQEALASNFSTLADYEDAEKNISKAIVLNPNAIFYRSELFDVLANKAAFATQNKIETDEDLNEKISSAIINILQSKTRLYSAYFSLNKDLEVLKMGGVYVSDMQKQTNQKLLELNPNNPELYIDRALLNFNDYLLSKDGKLQLSDEDRNVLLNKVKRDLEKSISLKSDFVLGYYNLGLYYQEIGEGEKALENINKAFDLNTGEQIVALTLKKIYINQDNTEAAKLVLNKYLHSNPQDVSVMLELAVIFKNNKEYEQAKAELNEVLKIEPENLIAKQLISQIK